MKDLQKQLEIAKLEVVRLECEITYYNLNPTEKLATYLHSMLCHSNHVDDCGWFYSKDNEWTHYSKKRFYQMAVNLLKDDDIDVIMRIVDKIKKS